MKFNEKSLLSLSLSRCEFDYVFENLSPSLTTNMKKTEQRSKNSFFAAGSIKNSL